MKKLLKLYVKRLILLVVKNDSYWSFLNATIIRFADYAKLTRKRIHSINMEIILDIRKALTTISPNLTVQHGPFSGMVYPEMTAIGSSLVPKLLGSYEQELHPVLDAICANDYSEIIDIGCAEGYYACGLAMKIPTARVFAFDTNNEAIHLCKQMAEKNNVDERLVQEISAMQTH